MNRSATASQGLGNPERKNTPYFLDLAGVKFLLKKERVFFFRDSALQVFGQVAEQCGRSFAGTTFWGKDSAKLRLILFYIRMLQAEEEGSGEESSACSSFCFGEIRAGYLSNSSCLTPLLEKKRSISSFNLSVYFSNF